jgi:ABC-type multidrug transport system fused ATPase/permease subunit
MNLLHRLKNQNSTISKSLLLLSKRDRYKLALVCAVQIGLSFLDLLGIALMGLLGTLSVSGVQSRMPGDRIAELLEFFQLSDLNFQQQAGIIGIAAASVLILKTFLSILTTRKMLHFLSARGAELSIEITSGLTVGGLPLIRKFTNQEILYSINGGVNAILVGILGSTLSLIADLVLLLLIGTALLIADFVLAISTFTLFGLIALCLYVFLRVKARELGEVNAELSVQGNEKVLDLLDCFREIKLRNFQSRYLQELERIKKNQALTVAEIAFLPSISKFIIETAVVVGGLFIGAVQFLTADANRAFASISIFVAASTRITPALLRFQQSAVTFRTSEGLSKKTFTLIERINEARLATKELHGNKVPTESKGLDIDSLHFSYSNSSAPVLKGISFKVPAGSRCGIIGVSGAGKSTLADLIIGAVEPTTGHIYVNGLTPSEVAKSNPGEISFVPQEVKIIKGTIRENILLGFNRSEIDAEVLNYVLDQSSLRSFVRDLPLGLDTMIGEGVLNLSGGQKQRLGIARALVTQPSFLILDETTSALDANTEAEITQALNDLPKGITLVVIAHRLSTIRNFEKIVHLSKGQIDGVGSFEEVRTQSSIVDNQAKLLGL